MDVGFAELFFLILFTVQAPILGPAAFGLIAAVMVFVAFWEGVPGRAFDEALLSIRDVEPLHFATITTAGAVLCLAFGAAVYGLANPLAAAFGNAELASVMRVMAVLPLLNAFLIAPMVAAKREMRFRSLALRTISSLTAGGIVGMALALTGGGVWALVWQAVVQRLVAVVVLWLAAPIPLQFGFSRRHFRELAAFAMPVMLSRLMGWASGQLPRLILGLHLGSTDLGLFSIGARLDVIVRNVAFGPRAMVARVDLRRFASDREALRHAVRRVFLHISVLSFPIAIGGLAVVPSLFHAWLDPRWYSAILPSQLMLLSSTPHVTLYGATALLYALNLQKWEAGIATALGLGVLVAVAVASPFGLVATTAAIAAVSASVVPLSLIIIHRTCGLSPRDILLPQAPAFVAACLMGGVVSLLRMRIETAHSNMTALGIEIVAGAAVYVLILAAMMPRRMVRALQYVRADRPA